MLVKEVRATIEKYNKKELEGIVVELYKQVPKTKKESVDEYLRDINAHKKIAFEKESLPYEEECARYDRFIALAKAGCYASPNRIVAKSERQKWRSLVRHYYKLFAAHNEEIDRLVDLFKVLSKGTRELVFTTWNTFKACGVAQEEYYALIVERVLKSGFTKQNLELLVALINVDRDDSANLSYVLSHKMPTIDTKEMLIEAINASYDKDLYLIKNTREYMNYCYCNWHNEKVEAVTVLYFDLCEEKMAERYFKNNYYEKSIYHKTRSYLDFLRRHNFKEQFLTEYERLEPKLDKEGNDRYLYNYYLELIQDSSQAKD